MHSCGRRFNGQAWSFGGTSRTRAQTGQVAKQPGFDRTSKTGLANALEHMMSAEDVNAQCANRLRPGFTDMRDAGAVIDDRWPQISERARDCRTIEDVDRCPQHPRIVQQVPFTIAEMRPTRNLTVMFEKMIDQVTAGKPCGAGDQRRTMHGCQTRRPYCAS